MRIVDPGEIHGYLERCCKLHSFPSSASSQQFHANGHGNGIQIVATSIFPRLKINLDEIHEISEVSPSQDLIVTVNLIISISNVQSEINDEFADQFRLLRLDYQGLCKLG
jgi:hypothetical protein